MTTPLAEPIFTPATKAAVGDHDENISSRSWRPLIGADARRRGARHRHPPLQGRRLRARAASSSPTPSSSSASTRHGTLTLMDEVLTPDSSRFWLADELAQGRIHALDKQPLRDWLAAPASGGAEQAALDLPDEVILGVHERYERACTAAVRRRRVTPGPERMISNRTCAATVSPACGRARGSSSPAPCTATKRRARAASSAC
jgi:phosphoribosylaminoimidazole-succinocarboxamide synthase